MALFTQTSIAPQRATTFAAADSTSAALLTSAGRMKPSPPARSTSARVARRPSSPRAIKPMRKPRRAKATALARPTPEVAPVRTTTGRSGKPLGTLVAHDVSDHATHATNGGREGYDDSD